VNWWRRRRNGHDAAKMRAAAEESLRQAKSETPAVHRMADRLAKLAPDELVARITAAFGDPHR
jgi:hypothetical protein